MSNIFLRSVLLKMQTTKKQAFPTKNRLPADKFLPAEYFAPATPPARF